MFVATGECGPLPEVVRGFGRIQAAPFVPEVQLWLADELVPLWQAIEWRAAAPQPPPFWAFAWPGSMALARYVLDTPSAVASRRVLDFGSGCGLAAIAAAMAGAAFVQAFDIDPLATTMQQLNAELNSVAFESRCADPLDGEGFIDRQVSKNPVHGELSDLDVIFAGDVCYDRESSARVTAWLRRQANQGATVLLADPGRHYVPSDGLELLATYDVPVLTELESTTHKRTLLWRLTPEQAEEDDY